MDKDYAGLYEAMVTGTAKDVVPRWTVDYLGAVVDGRVSISAVRHPLGFLCLPVWRGDDLGICVHMWTDIATSADLTTSAVHAHSWELTSYVLYGQVRNQIFDVRDTESEPTHRVFEIHTVQGIDFVRRTPRVVRCDVATADEHGFGDVYTLPSGVYHTTVVSEYAATVALGRNCPGRMDVSLGGIQAPDHEMRRQLCSPAQTQQAMSTVLAKLGWP